MRKYALITILSLLICSLIGGPSFSQKFLYWKSSVAELNAIAPSVDNDAVHHPANGDKAIVFDASHAVTFYDHLSGAWAAIAAINDGGTAVEVFGAKGDTTNGTDGTDDTAAFQLAINSGKHILLSDKQYKIAGRLKLPPYTTPVSITGANGTISITRADAKTIVWADNEVLFEPLVPNTYGSVAGAMVDFRKIFFQAGSYRGSNIVFNGIILTNSTLKENVFSGFNHVLYGAISNLTVVEGNAFSACTGGCITKLGAEYYTSLGVSADSYINHNYFNGDNGFDNVVLVDLSSSSSMVFSNNYLDFAYTGLLTGVGNGLVQIFGNTFDTLYRAIDSGYAGRNLNIYANNFIRINNASKSYFTTLSAAMDNTDWTCIYLQESQQGLSITGNKMFQIDRFMDLPNRGYGDIEEYGNTYSSASGPTILTKPLVSFADRSVNTTLYPFDDNNLRFASIENKNYTMIPHYISESYDGHIFRYYGILLRNTLGAYLDSGGTNTFGGRTNLNPSSANNFKPTVGVDNWVITGTGVSVDNATGILTAIGDADVYIYCDLATPGAAGTYIAYIHTPTHTNNLVNTGLYLDDASTLTPENYLAASGYWNLTDSYQQFTVPVGRTVTKLAVNIINFTGTIDEVRFYKVQ